VADAAAAGPEPARKYPCTHPEFNAHVVVGRIEPDLDDMPMAYVADIRVNCGMCGIGFDFMGLPAGLSFDEPRVSVGGDELHAPIRPADAEPRPGGSGMPGFSVRMYTPGAGGPVAG
jgi:hypothetical protein